MSDTYKSDDGAKWEKRFALARSSQERMFKRFSNWYDALYAQINVETSPWRSKIYVPILARQTWSLVSKFLALKPGFEVRVRDNSIDDDELRSKAEKAQRKLEYDYDNPLLDESIRDKLYSVLLDAVVTGTGVAKVAWTVKTMKRYERMADKYGNIDLTKEKVYTKKMGYNDLIPVNIFNVYVSPSAKDLYTSPWVIIKEFKPISDLKKANKDGLEVYKNLDKLSALSSYDSNTQYSKSRNRLLTNQDDPDATVDMVAIYECYEGDKICTYAEQKSGEGWMLLSERKNPYWHGKYPLVKFHVKKKPFQFWGEGLFEVTYRLQAAYNDVFNHYLDAWNVSNDPMLIAPETANINDYVIQPAGLITYRGNTAPQQFKHAAPDPGQLQTIVSLFDSAIEGVTVSQYASGMPNSETDKTKGTATGIVKLQEAAGDIISFFRANFQQSILQTGRMWLSNNQQFMQDTLTLEGNAGTKMQAMEISPLDLQGDMELTIDDASMQPTTKEEQRDQAVAFVQQLIGIKQVSDMQAQQIGTKPMALNTTELAETIADRFGIKNFEKLLVTDEELAQYQQEGMMQAMQAMQVQEQQQAQMQQEQAMQQQQQAQQEEVSSADEEVQGMVQDLQARGEL